MLRPSGGSAAVTRRSRVGHASVTRRLRVGCASVARRSHSGRGAAKRRPLGSRIALRLATTPSPLALACSENRKSPTALTATRPSSHSISMHPSGPAPSQRSWLCHRLVPIAPATVASVLSPAQPRSSPFRLTSATTRTPGESASPNTSGRARGHSSCMLVTSAAPTQALVATTRSTRRTPGTQTGTKKEQQEFSPCRCEIVVSSLSFFFAVRRSATSLYRTCRRPSCVGLPRRAPHRNLAGCTRPHRAAIGGGGWQRR